MKSVIIILFACFSVLFCQSIENPLTIPEQSNYKSTSRHADVMDFIKKLQQRSDRVRVETMATTAEGREIPLIIIGDPVPRSPEDLKNNDRAVVYFQGNIHAGEVEGKESLQMLARDLALNDDLDYLDDLIVLIAPIFNADGNEKISTKNRTRQVGPENGVGERYNGQNLDINRDGLKLETPEAQGLVNNVMERWDPHLLLDSHTHNGSYHEEAVTYVWHLNPNGDNALIHYMFEKMYPDVVKIMKENYQTDLIPHGDFVDPRLPEKGWKPLDPQPRYLSNYFGLRNRLGILNENYPYADFKTRVLGAYKLFRALLDYCSKNKAEIIDLIDKVDKRTIERANNFKTADQFYSKYDVRPIPGKLTIKGYEMTVEDRPGGWPSVKKTDKRKNYTMPFYADFYGVDSTQLPYAYLIPPPHKNVVRKLRQHGIKVHLLTKDTQVNVQKFKIEELSPAPRLNQGHYLNQVKGEFVADTLTVPSGTYVVTMNQPLANVVSYLLEAESDDGLLKWNFFDRYIMRQWGRQPLPYPVLKLMEKSDLDMKSIAY